MTRQLTSPDITPHGIATQAGATSPEVFDIYKALHNIPELSGAEYQTSQFVEDQLRASGITSKHIVGTSLYCTVGEQTADKKILLKFDLDALLLPNLGSRPWDNNSQTAFHACFHAGHTAIGIGLAQFFQNLIDKGYLGNVCLIFLFQSREEMPDEYGLLGAHYVLRSGKLPAYDIALGLHGLPDAGANIGLPFGKFGLNEGQVLVAGNTIITEIYCEDYSSATRDVPGMSMSGVNNSAIDLAAHYILNLNKEIGMLRSAGNEFGFLSKSSQTQTTDRYNYPKVVLTHWLGFDETAKELRVLSACDRARKRVMLDHGGSITINVVQSYRPTYNAGWISEIARQSIERSLGADAIATQQKMFRASDDVASYILSLEEGQRSPGPAVVNEAFDGALFTGSHYGASMSRGMHIMWGINAPQDAPLHSPFFGPTNVQEALKQGLMGMAAIIAGLALEDNWQR